MLPWGTPECIGYRDEIALLNFVTKYLSWRYDCRRWKWQCLFNFEKKSWVPHFIKSLADVQKGRCAVSTIFQSFVYYVC